MGRMPKDYAHPPGLGRGAARSTSTQPTLLQRLLSEMSGSPRSRLKSEHCNSQPKTPNRPKQIALPGSGPSELVELNQGGLQMPALIPPFTHETAIAKVRMVEDAWNSRDLQRVSLGYTGD